MRTLPIFLAGLLASSFASAQALPLSGNAADAAYQAYEQALELRCDYQFGGPLEDDIRFLERLRPTFHQKELSLSDGRVIARGLLETTQGHTEIQVMAWPGGDNGAISYETEIGNATLGKATQKGTSDLKAPPSFPIPGEQSIRSEALLALYRRLELGRLSCGFHQPNALAFRAEDLARKVHINVHPHLYYDKNSELAPFVNPLLAQPNLLSFVLLEYRGARSLSDRLRGIPFPSFDQQLTITPSPATEFRVAGNGIIPIRSYRGHLPTEYVFTGGMFNACMSHALYQLFSELRYHAENEEIRIDLPTEAILAQTGPGDIEVEPFPGMGPTIRLADLKRDHPKVFLAHLSRFLRSHYEDWTGPETKAYFRVFLPGKEIPSVRFELISEQGKLLAGEGDTTSEKRVVFQLK